MKMLFVGPFPDPSKFVRPALPNQRKNISAVWNNEKATTFGIERLFRPFLVFSAYLFPGLYIRHFSGKSGQLSRKLWLDIFVTAKLLLPAGMGSILAY